MSRQSYFKGRSVDSIANMDITEFMNLSKTQLRQAVSRLADAANKRLKRLEKSGINSMAAFEVNESGGRFSTRGKDTYQLQAEFQRARQFISDATSTVKGATIMMKAATKTVKDVYGVSLSISEYNKLIGDYSKMVNYDTATQSRKLRYSILYSKVGITTPTAEQRERFDSIARDMIATVERYQSPGGMGYDGFSNFFGFDQ